MRAHISNLPNVRCDDAERMADAIEPIIAEFIQMYVEKYDAPTAVGIGAAALVFLMSGLSDTYDDMAGMGRDEPALDVFIEAITDAINNRIVRAAARLNGDLN